MVDNDYQNSESAFNKHIQPSSLYALFECKLDSIGPTYMRIFSEWNDEQYKVNDKNIPCFEYYPPNTVKADDEVLIYIPIIKTS